MTTFKNVGTSVWRRRAGPNSPVEVVPPGGTFVATPREERRIARRTHLQRRLIVVPDEVEVVATQPTPVVVKVELPVVTPSDPKPKWPLRMPPRQYIRLHPQGQYAKLARRVLEVESDGGEK